MPFSCLSKSIHTLKPFVFSQACLVLWKNENHVEAVIRNTVDFCFKLEVNFYWPTQSPFTVGYGICPTVIFLMLNCLHIMGLVYITVPVKELVHISVPVEKSKWDVLKQYFMFFARQCTLEKASQETVHHENAFIWKNGRHNKYKTNWN